MTYVSPFVHQRQVYTPPPTHTMATNTHNNRNHSLFQATLSEQRRMASSLVDVEVEQGPWRPETELDELEIELKAVGEVVEEARTGIVGFLSRWFMGSRIPTSVQETVSEQLQLADTVAEEPIDGLDEVKNAENKVVRRKPRRDNSGWWMAYSVAARGKWGRHSDTNATRMSVRKYIYDEMREDLVTKLDVARVIDEAVEWVFVPSEGEIKSHQVRNARAVWERTKEARRPWWSYWWGVSHRP